MNINTFEDKVFMSIQQDGQKGGDGWVTHYLRNEGLARSMQSLCQFIWETAEDLNP